MAAKRKKTEAETERTLVMADGQLYAITGETDRYWQCGETQFRKSNSCIAAIQEAPAPADGEPEGNQDKDDDKGGKA